MNYRIDNLQYCKWSREVFQINRDAGLDAVHVTVVYHEDYEEFLKRVSEWDSYFKENSDLIFLGKSYKDIEKARQENKPAKVIQNLRKQTKLAYFRTQKDFRNTQAEKIATIGDAVQVVKDLVKS